MDDQDKEKLYQSTEYELFVKDVLEKINATSGWENLKLQHNVVLTGKSGASHQIDIYWEFTAGIVTHKVAVECKGYSSAVTKEKIASFFGVLSDLDGVQGVYASQMGYQKGAVQFAKSNGIKLLEIRRPIKVDHKGRIWNIGINIQMKSRINVVFRVDADKELCTEDELKTIEGSSDPNSVFIEDAGNRKSFYQILNEVKDDGNPHQVYDFKYQDAYLIKGNRCIRIKGLHIEYDVVSSEDEIVIRGDDVIKSLVKDISDQKEQIVDWTGNVRDRRIL